MKVAGRAKLGMASGMVLIPVLTGALWGCSNMLLPRGGQEGKAVLEGSTRPGQDPAQDGSYSQDKAEEEVLKEISEATGLASHKSHYSRDALTSGGLWASFVKHKDQVLKEYVNTHREGYDAFTKAPVSYNGTPALIFRLLPEVMPELFGQKEFERQTGYYFAKSADLIPYGFAFTKPPVTAQASPSPLFVTFTCGACHTGRVMTRNGVVKTIVGGASRVADINGYRSLLTAAIQHPSFQWDKFAAALKLKKDGELYGPDRIAEEKVDKAIYLSPSPTSTQPMGALIVRQFKEGLLKKKDFALQTFGSYTFKNDLRTLERLPGRIDFPTAVVSAVAPLAEIKADPAAALRKYFPTGPGVGDIMSVWRQDKRVYAQWDGNLKTKLIRNLGAEVGIAQEPKAVNFQNAVKTTDFVEKLPSPAYPFKVNLVKAAMGRLVYLKACASCHEGEKFIPLTTIETEPGRAIGLTSASRELLVSALKASCQDQTNPGCQAPDHEIVVPRQSRPGYISAPLDGIWARAPYLHNASVPTLYHLLVPEERPAEFSLSNLKYDERYVGFEWRLNTSTAGSKGSSEEGTHQVKNDTRIPGLDNRGHSNIKVFHAGIDFKKDKHKLEALLEYLKTK